MKKRYLRKYVVERPPLDSFEKRYGDNRPTVGDIQVSMEGLGQKDARARLERDIPKALVGKQRKKFITSPHL